MFFLLPSFGILCLKIKQGVPRPSLLQCFLLLFVYLSILLCLCMLFSGKRRSCVGVIFVSPQRVVYIIRTQ